jgi:hypothetical protein
MCRYVSSGRWPVTPLLCPERLFVLLVRLVQSGELVLIAGQVRWLSTDREPVSVAKWRHYDCNTVVLHGKFLHILLRRIHIGCTFLVRNPCV